MRPKKAVRWTCSAGELLTEEPEIKDIYAHISEEPSDDGLVHMDTITLNVEGYTCPECDAYHDAEPGPEKVEGFICGECEEFYEDREDAKECCK